MVKGESIDACLFCCIPLLVEDKMLRIRGNLEYMISKENIGHIRKKIRRGLDRLLTYIILKSKIFFITYIEELFLLVISSIKIADDSSNVSLSYLDLRAVSLGPACLANCSL